MDTNTPSTLRTLTLPANIDDILRRAVAQDATDQHPDLKLIVAWRGFITAHIDDSGLLPRNAAGGVRYVKPAFLVAAEERATAAGLLESSKVPPAFTPDAILRLQAATRSSPTKEPVFDRAAKGVATGLTLAAIAAGIKAAVPISRRTLFKVAGATGAGGGLLLGAGTASASSCTSGNCQYYQTWCEQGNEGYDGYMAEQVNYYWDYNCFYYCGTDHYRWCSGSCPCSNNTPLYCCHYTR